MGKHQEPALVARAAAQSAQSVSDSLSLLALLSSCKKDFLPTHNSKSLQDLIGESIQSCLQEKSKKMWEPLIYTFSQHFIGLMCARHLPAQR